MQIFEFHFNPKIREDRFFDSFLYEPESIYEKKLGSLFFVGELYNSILSNIKLLDNVAKTLKTRYYNLSNKSPERAISEGLKKANDFFSEEVKKDNVGWLGNLNCAVMSLKDLNLIFTKTGDLKILLIRAGQINDIGKNLDPSELDPYPVKVFFNIVSGRLNEGDIVLVLTKEIFDFFLNQNILNKFAKTEFLDDKKIREILPSDLFTKGDGAKISGICLVALMEKAQGRHLKPKEIYYRKKEKFSLLKKLSVKIKSIKKKFRFLGKIKDAFSTVKNPLKRFKVIKKSKEKSASRRKKKFKFKIKLPALPSFEKLLKNPEQKRNLILVAVLIIFILLGFLVFK